YAGDGFGGVDPGREAWVHWDWVAGYINRGCGKRGFLLMLFFLVWRIVLKVDFWWFFLESYGCMALFCAVGEGGLALLGEVMKSVVFTVYYHDCRMRFLEIDWQRQKE
ncbi:hypothetical protein LINGRAHAP2_LOCUS23178, partial [Linum grandiflorum]